MSRMYSLGPLFERRRIRDVQLGERWTDASPPVGLFRFRSHDLVEGAAGPALIWIKAAGIRSLRRSIACTSEASPRCAPAADEDCHCDHRDRGGLQRALAGLLQARLDALCRAARLRVDRHRHTARSDAARSGALGRVAEVPRVTA